MKWWQTSFVIKLFCKLFSQLHYAPFIHFQTPWRRGNHTTGLFDNFKKAKVRSLEDPNANATAIQSGIKTPNEVREKEGMEPLPAGDNLMIQGATLPI